MNLAISAAADSVTSIVIVGAPVVVAGAVVFVVVVADILFFSLVISHQLKLKAKS
jgi:hypothetical protein